MIKYIEMMNKKIYAIFGLLLVLLLALDGIALASIFSYLGLEQGAYVPIYTQIGFYLAEILSISRYIIVGVLVLFNIYNMTGMRKTIIYKMHGKKQFLISSLSQLTVTTLLALIFITIQFVLNDFSSSVQYSGASSYVLQIPAIGWSFILTFVVSIPIISLVVTNIINKYNDIDVKYETKQRKIINVIKYVTKLVVIIVILFLMVRTVNVGPSYTSDSSYYLVTDFHHINWGLEVLSKIVLLIIITSDYIEYYLKKVIG